MARNAAVVQPNLGLYFDRPSIALGNRMLQNGMNFRVKEGKLSNLNLGWERFEATIQLNGPVLLIFDFLHRDGTDILVLASKTDLYKYNPGPHTVSYITPIYATGTAAANGTAVTGTGTLWNSGSPVNVKAGDQISFGSANQVSTSATWFTIATVNTDTSITLTGSAGVIADGVYTIRKLFTGDEGDIWVPDVFVNASPSTEDELWLTNGLEAPVKWNGTTSQVVPQNALGFTCKVLGVFENMMIFANLLQGGTAKPTDIINSNIGEPANVSSGLSEQFKVHGGVDEIKALVPLGDSLGIYSLDTLTVAQFVGDPLIFIFRNAITGTGALSIYSVADFGDHHEFLGRGSQFLFDGATVREVGKQVFRDILRQQDPSRSNRIYHHFDEENGDLIWVVPSTVDPGSGDLASPPSRAVGEHYLEEVGQQSPTPMSLRSFPFTATGFFTRTSGLTWDQLTAAWSAYNFRWNDQFFFAAFPLNMGGTNDGKLYTFSSAQDADGAALVSFVKFGRRAVADGRMRGLVSRIYPFVTTFTSPLDVTLYMADHAQGVATINHTDSFDQSLPEGGHFTTPYRRGRFMEVEFGTDGPGQPWELSGYDVDVKQGGRR